MSNLQACFGLICFILIAWSCSESRHAVRLKVVAAGLIMQLTLAIVLVRVPAAADLFLPLAQAVQTLQAATQQGTAFVFGYLGGGANPFDVSYPEYGFVLAFQALPLLMVMSALSALLFHWGILPWVLRGLSWLLQRSFRISGALGLGTSANVFVGMTEAPLLIRPYLNRMNRSELFALMVTGMATIAGTVMVLYASFLDAVIPNATQHILTASLISAPASLLIAHLMVPAETATQNQGPHTNGEDGKSYSLSSPYTSSMDAVTTGTLSGLQLWLNVVAMLLVLVALVALANSLLALAPNLNGEALTIERLFGWLMAPVAWLTGIPWSEAIHAGSLLGIKTILNEMLAYLSLMQLPADALSERSRIILTYALCGFANIASLGILLGGLTFLAPIRKAEITALGWKALVGGTLSTLMTGSVIGILI